jgi:hypothetical protein
MLRLFPVDYTYKNGKETKTAKVETYLIKGVRGAVRHQTMAICNDRGLEVCHSTDKEVDKSGNKLLPAGFHLLGNCLNNGGPCIIHSIFGSKGHEGKISLTSLPIASIPHKTFKSDIELQKVQIATENRLCKTFTGKSVQDFGERYFSGQFTFEIDVTKCDETELGLLLNAAIKLDRLGRGYNSGYGHLKVLKFQLVKRKIKRYPEWQDDSFVVKEDITEESLAQEVIDALQDWEEYISCQNGNVDISEDIADEIQEES